MKGVIDKIATAVINHAVDILSSDKKLIEKNTEELKNHLKKTLKSNTKLVEEITKYAMEGAKNG